VRQTRFHTVAGGVIECDRSPHALGSGFPGQSSIAAIAPRSRHMSHLTEMALQRMRRLPWQITKRYLFSDCQVMSVESNPLVRGKVHSIEKSTRQTQGHLSFLHEGIYYSFSRYIKEGQLSRGSGPALRVSP
jgi:hypothetical protein